MQNPAAEELRLPSAPDDELRAEVEAALADRALLLGRNGKAVHVPGGVGLGGVLEPPGARPVIIEDGAFIGSRCIVVEGVLVGEEAVLGAGVVLTASTTIYDVTGPEERALKGSIPPRSVVI